VILERAMFSKANRVPPTWISPNLTYIHRIWLTPSCRLEIFFLSLFRYNTIYSIPISTSIPSRLPVLACVLICYNWACESEQQTVMCNNINITHRTWISLAAGPYISWSEEPSGIRCILLDRYVVAVCCG